MGSHWVLLCCTLKCSLLVWRWKFTVETCSSNVTWLYVLYEMASHWVLLCCTLICSLLAWRWPFTVETCSRNVTWWYIYNITVLIYSLYSIRLHPKQVLQSVYRHELETRLSHKPWKQEIAKIPDWPRRNAVAEFRLCVGHDCLGTHLQPISIRPDP